MVVAHGGDGEIVARAVADAGSIRRRNEFGIPSLRDEQAGANGVISPAETDDLIVFRPFGEGVVGGVEYDDAAARAEVAEELFFDRERPAFGGFEVTAVVVQDDDVGARKRRSPSGGATGRNADLEAAGGFEDLADRMANTEVSPVHVASNHKQTANRQVVMGNVGQPKSFRLGVETTQEGKDRGA